MSGLTCGDHGSKPLGDTTPLCLAPANHPVGEFFSYPDGRVAVIKSESGGKVTFAGPNGQGEMTLEGLSPASLENTRKMQGAEFGDCSAQGGHVTFEVLPTDGGVTWTFKDQIALNPVFGDRTGRVFLCSDRENYGTIGINTSKAYNAQLIRGFKTLRSKCSSLLGEGSADKCTILKGVADLYVPKGEQSTWDQFKGIAGYLLGGIFVFAVGGLAAHILGNWWNNRGGGNGPKPPSGGGGGGGNKEFPLIPIDAMPEGARVLFPSGHVVKDGEIIGQAAMKMEATDGGGLPQGVVTADEGALIYRPEYQARIDGQWVALPPESGLQLLAGGDYTYAEFMEKAGAVSSPAPIAVDEIVRSAALKGPGKIAVPSVARLSTEDEAAAAALERASSAEGARVNGVPAGGVGRTAPAPTPVWRGAPVRIAVP